MAKLARDEFLRIHAHFTQRARENFERDQHVAPVLAGFDIKGKDAMAVGTDPGQVNSTEAQGALKQGLHVLPAPFREHKESVLAFLNSANCVAAIVVGEAWLAYGDVAQDVMEMGIAASEHPSRQEVVLVSAVWPREYVQRHNVIDIHRDEHGRGFLGENRSPEMLGPQGYVVEWLSGMLPQPHGRR